MEFQLLIKTKILKIKAFLVFRHSDVVFIKLINIKMPTIVGILTFISMINFMLNSCSVELSRNKVYKHGASCCMCEQRRSRSACASLHSV